jgi:rhamnogalacturonyl hydrolase YesR
MTQATTRVLSPAFNPASLADPALTVYDSLKRVEKWVEDHNYEAYEPFDGLSSPLGHLTRVSPLADRLLQQVGRQSPINFRPLLGVKPLPSTKGRGYMAAGYLGLFRLTGDAEYRRKAVACLDWLMANKSPKFDEYSWANHFDYASRGGRYGTHESIIVWSALIGQAFLDAYELLGEARYLNVAESVCRWILGLPQEKTGTGICISYHMLEQNSVHNASMLGAGLLARTWSFAKRPEYLALASAAMEYSCSRQLPDGAWWYGEAEKYHWIDNFHTGYNLDSLQCYIESTGDETFKPQLDRGFAYFHTTFFEPSGRPKYYDNRAYPIDIQCASQAIETLTKFSTTIPAALPTAVSVARWTIDQMQDRTGYFYYRRYPLGVVARIPMLHWGQATMFQALALLLQRLARQERAGR